MSGAWTSSDAPPLDRSRLRQRARARAGARRGGARLWRAAGDPPRGIRRSDLSSPSAAPLGGETDRALGSGSLGRPGPGRRRLGAGQPAAARPWLARRRDRVAVQVDQHLLGRAEPPAGDPARRRACAAGGDRGREAQAERGAGELDLGRPGRVHRARRLAPVWPAVHRHLVRALRLPERHSRQAGEAGKRGAPARRWAGARRRAGGRRPRAVPRPRRAPHLRRGYGARLRAGARGRRRPVPAGGRPAHPRRSRAFARRLPGRGAARGPQLHALADSRRGGGGRARQPARGRARARAELAEAGARGRRPDRGRLRRSRTGTPDSVIAAAFRTFARRDLHLDLRKFGKTFDPPRERLPMCPHHVSRATCPGWRTSDLISCLSSHPRCRRGGRALRLLRFERGKRPHRFLDAPALGHIGAQRRHSGVDPRKGRERGRHSRLGTVTFVAPFGTLTDSGGAPANTVTLATDGTGTINYSCNVAVDSRCVAGNVFVSGSWSSAGKTLTLTVSNVAPGGGTPPPPPGGGGTPPPPVGTPPGPPTNIAVTASNPPVLGLKGSGIQERGTIAYLVTDSLGVPAPGITVNFALQAPTLGITLLKTSAVSDLNGVVTEGYTSGAEVGVTAITATIPTTGAFVLQPVAVRGAKPSANGFYFRCANASLPVYTTVMEYEKTACTVRLTDRFGNRVGIPTVVNFATEAGAIAASVTTKGFRRGFRNGR